MRRPAESNLGLQTMTLHRPLSIRVANDSLSPQLTELLHYPRVRFLDNVGDLAYSARSDFFLVFSRPDDQYHGRDARPNKLGRRRLWRRFSIPSAIVGPAPPVYLSPTVINAASRSREQRCLFQKECHYEPYQHLRRQFAFQRK